MSKTPKESPLGKPSGLDYVFMIGAPVAFVLLAVFGILYLRGPVPGPSAVQKLRDGLVKPGMTFTQVIKAVGEPKAIVEKPDGGTTLQYYHDTSVPYEQEDGFVQINEGGFVTGVTVERSGVPAPPADTP